MVIAICGSNHTEKRRLGRGIVLVSGGRFQRLETTTTRPSFRRKRHPRMSEAEFRALDRSEIVYDQVVEGYHYFYLKSQFIEEQDVLYVVDDPDGVEAIKSLGVPYAVIFVDSDTETILRRADADFHDRQKSIYRYNQTICRLNDFRDSFEYSFYLNTAIANSKAALQIAASTFYGEIMQWMESRSPDEVHMPTFADCDIQELKFMQSVPVSV